VSLAAIVALIALVQFLAVSLLRPRTRAHGISAAAFAVAWLVIFGMALPSKASAKPAAAAAAGGGSGLACVVAEKGMTAETVMAKAGKPDEKRSDEDTRGPGAAIWIYRDARCSVHMLNDKVEFAE